MTKIKKTLLLIVSLCLIAAGVFGCGSDNANAANEDAASTNAGILEELVEMSDDELNAYLTDYADQLPDYLLNALNGWVDVRDDIGDFVSNGEVKVTSTNGTTTVEQTENFTERNITVTIVYDGDVSDGEISDITIDKVYTLGETMTKAAMNTAMGMGTVFMMLIIISLIISCFKFINKAQSNSESTQAAPAAAAPAPVAVPQTDDLELVAVIAAAIAAATGSSTDDFVVRSIKRR
jgi:sodium pump decarboxylase gamma subunit